MFWLPRPTYTRWVAAFVLVVGALALDLSNRRTEPYPFLTADVMAGATIDDHLVEWRNVPAGLLPHPPDLSASAAVNLSAGEPLVPGAVTSVHDIPPGWWSVPVELPDGVGTGIPVRLVAAEPPVDTEGIVAQPGTSGAFAMTSPGLVAVPPDTAGSVAVAAMQGTLLVLIGS